VPRLQSVARDHNRVDPRRPRIFDVIWGLIPAHLRRIIGLLGGRSRWMGNAMSNHKFKVGQTVNYTPRFIGTVRADAIFKITRLLPAEDDELQYRIRSASEPYERVAKESQLGRAA